MSDQVTQSKGVSVGENPNIVIPMKDRRQKQAAELEIIRDTTMTFRVSRDEANEIALVAKRKYGLTLSTYLSIVALAVSRGRNPLIPLKELEIKEPLTA